MKQISVSVPGKIHFLGEHVVVYGKPALLAAIDRRCRVTIESISKNLIEVTSKNFSVVETTNQKDLIKKALSAKASWEKFIENGDISYLTRITKKELDYACIAIGETILFYEDQQNRHSGKRSASRISKDVRDPGQVEDARTGARMTQGFRLTIDSDIPVGAGLGSSAALAVAIAAATTLLIRHPELARHERGRMVSGSNKIPDQVRNDIFNIAFATEQRKHGRPSGGDPATSLYGGLVWYRRETDDVKIIEPVSVVIPPSIAERFFTIHTGKPVESTGEMIAIVKKFTEKNPKKARGIFDDQEKLTREILAAIKQNDEQQLMNIIKHGEGNLEALGVVSIYVKKIIRDIEESGGAAKISGGGGKTKGAGTLLVYHKEKKKLEGIVKKYGLLLDQMKLGVEGLRIES
ncbi:MAG: hypothetical protein HY430_03555 [Candidatus Levybacteria bacterium]|nr:hypothetical protein [Candidatus Levybacteria bacterium]